MPRFQPLKQQYLLYNYIPTGTRALVINRPQCICHAPQGGRLTSVSSFVIKSSLSYSLPNMLLQKLGGKPFSFPLHERSVSAPSLLLRDSKVGVKIASDIQKCGCWRKHALFVPTKSRCKDCAPCLHTPPWVFLQRRSRRPPLTTALALRNLLGSRRRKPEPPGVHEVVQLYQTL